MKNIYKHLSLVFVLIGLLLSSCNDFLDVTPEGKVTEEDIRTNINNLNVQLAGVYSQLAKNDFEKSLYRFGELCGDNVTPTNTSATHDDVLFATFNYSPSHPYLQTFWDACYKAIKASNDYLNSHEIVYKQWMELVDEIASEYNTNQSEFLSQSETQNNLMYMAGEARFIRALSYFYLVRTFGEIPIQPDELYLNGGENNFYQPRKPVDSVYQYIERDLRSAVATCRLPINFSDSYVMGRVTNYAAAGLLVKVLGYQKKWDEILKYVEWMNTDGVKLTYGELLSDVYPTMSWEDISEHHYFFKYRTTPITADAIVSSPKSNVGLFADYDMVNRIENEFNKEILFEINHVYSGDGSTNDNNLGTTVWNDLQSFSDDAYISTDIKAGACTYLASYNFSAQYGALETGDRDVRAAFAATANDTYLRGQEEYLFNIVNPSPSLRYIMKTYVMKKDWPQNRVLNDNPKNVIIMRYAEVLLWYAEALNELGRGNEAISVLNELRHRANNMFTDKDDRWDYVNWFGQSNIEKGSPDANKINPLLDLPVLSQDLNREAIWRERTIELCFEWDRFYDMVRTGKAYNASKAWNYTDGYPLVNLEKNFKENIHEVFAIPQDEIDKAGGRWIQNPGH